MKPKKGKGGGEVDIGGEFISRKGEKGVVKVTPLKGTVLILAY